MTVQAEEALNFWLCHNLQYVEFEIDFKIVADAVVSDDPGSSRCLYGVFGPLIRTWCVRV